MWGTDTDLLFLWKLTVVSSLSPSVLLELRPQSQRDVQRLQRRSLLRLLLPAQRLGEAPPHLQPRTSGSTQTGFRHHCEQGGGCSRRRRGLSSRSGWGQGPWKCALSLQSWWREGISRFSLLHPFHPRLGPRDQRTLRPQAAKRVTCPPLWLGKNWISGKRELFEG